MISIFTTITDPRIRGDAWKPAFECYKDLADEFVVVDGSKDMKPESGFSNPEMKVIVSKWPKEFDWPFIGQQFQRGYEACSGEVVIHADLDFLFHEKDFEAIREAADRMLDSHAPAMSFYKYQFILPDRYNLKSRLVIMVNKRDFGDRIRFDSGGDLCQPSLDGRYISPDSVPEAKLPFWNYEKLTKTKEQIMDDVGRMDRAYKRHFGKYIYGDDGSDKSAYEGWLKMAGGRFSKPQQKVSLKDHPQYIQEAIKNLKPEHWGYNGLGELGVSKCYE